MLLGRLVEAEHEAQLRVLEQYDREQEARSPPQASSSIPSVASMSSKPALHTGKPSTTVATQAEELKARDATVVATVVRRDTTYILTPHITVTETTGSWKNFLIGGSKRILPSIAEKHTKFSYAPTFDKGVLTRLELSGLDESMWGELKSPIIWAFDRAREPQQ